ncbi:cytochrome P450 4F6-like [Gigantopelta aegis]|uniref:cytochrome P450 4F6-like n=1 Tax=Gigantopelta aegis TaxID=1735272 RepID=UPI001B88B8A5|nr:cytochrome P450 4F6-like [Gigantopelta aegis]
MVAVLSSAVSILLVTAAVYCVILVVNAILKFKRKSSILKQVPQLPAHWLWGHLRDIPGPNEAGLKFKRDLMSVMPRLNLLWLGYLPMVNVKHPETAKLILKTSEPKGGAYGLIEPWVGDGLLITGGKKWARNRRLLTPAFHFDILKPYITIKNRAADIFLNKIKEFAKNDQYFEAFSHVSMYTLDVILKCAFSFDTDCQNIGGKHPYVLAVNENSELLAQRYFKPWLHPSWIYNLTSDGRRFHKNCDFVHKVAEDIIAKRKDALASGQGDETTTKRKKCLDFLDILLTAKDENGVGLSTLEIRNEVDTFLFEGHDTTASAISWTMFSLAGHPEHQEAVQKGIDDLMAGKKTEDIEMEDLAKLTHLNMCVKECLRLHSPVPFIQRITTQDMVIDDKPIPAGTAINIQLYCVHHNPLVWDNSMEFRPERFAPENCDNRNAYAFVPFSAGPRNCIGQNFALHEIKIFLARLLHKYSIKLDPNHKVLKRETVTMRAENGIRIKPILRQKHVT